MVCFPDSDSHFPKEIYLIWEENRLRVILGKKCLFFYHENVVLCVLIKIVSRDNPDKYTQHTCTIIWLELPIPRTDFQDPKDVRAIEVRLYVYVPYLS